MRKAILLGLMILGLVSLTGCNKQQDPDRPGVQQGEEGKPGTTGKKERTFVPEDFIPGGGSEVLRTEKGYYYRKGGDIRYKDFATGNDIYLCNKPECRHDGNEFCVATNDKYAIYEMRLYNGKLFAVATETTETQCMYKLLLIEPDGSAMDELVTYMTMEKTGQVPTGLGEFQIHRNLVMLPFAAVDVQKFSDTDAYGTAIYNLDTKELVYLDAEPFSKENSAAFSIQGYQDWFYYCKSEDGKTKLHRYNFIDGTDESFYDSYIHIYDHDLNKLTEFDFGDAVIEVLPEIDEYYESEKYTYLSRQPALRFLNGEAYCFVDGNTKEDIVYFTYRCKQSDLLAGKPVLELVYSTSVPISN